MGGHSKADGHFSLLMQTCLKITMFGTFICSHPKAKMVERPTKATDSYSQQFLLSDPTEYVPPQPLPDDRNRPSSQNTALFLEY